MTTCYEAPLTCGYEIMNEVAGCVNTPRPLAHSLDLTKEGMAVKATRRKLVRTCPACKTEHLSHRVLCAACHAATPVGTCIFQPCQRVPKAGRICSAHAQRLSVHGDPDTRLKYRNDPEGGFWARIDRDTAPPCWLWTGSLNQSGYGQIHSGDHPMAHRYSYRINVGPIPQGYEVDHVYDRGCRHRHCVNPDHLEAVTPAENKRRMMIVRGYNPGGKP